VGKVFRQRPFVLLVILFTGGIMTSRFCALPLTAGIIVICLALVLFLVRSMRWMAIAAFTFALGIALYSARYEIISENDLHLIFGEKAALVSIRGNLVETPGVREFPGRTNNVEYSYARVDVTEVLVDRQWRPAIGRIATATGGVVGPEYFKGRSVEVSGVLALPKRAPAPGMFDFRRYLYNLRIFYQLRCDSARDWRLTSFEPLPLTEKFQRWAHRQLARGLPARDEPLELVQAMALGTTRSLNGEVADVFMKTGTMHIFAISGLHVACIALCLVTLLRVAGVPRERAALILIPLIWFYTLATGWQSSAVRSALMSTFVFAGWAIRRPTELLNSTAGAALLILVFEPEQLFQASFQLSFAVVVAIALILGQSCEGEPWLMRVQNRLLDYDPLLPPELRPKWKQLLEIPIRFVLGNLTISIAAWIGSNPLTAYYFNMVTPISLAANLIAVPLSSVSLAGTLGSLLFPPLGPFFNYLSWATMWETIAVTRWLAHWSWGYFYVPEPNVWFFVAYFSVIAVCVIPVLRAGMVKRYSYGLAGLLLFTWIFSILPASRSTHLTIVPARGTPIMIDAPGRKNDLLVDCSNGRGAEQLVKRFLHGQGFGAVPNVLLTHGDVNHVGGFTNILAEFSPKAVFASNERSRSRAYKEVMARVQQTPGLLKTVGAGDAVLRWKVLHPARSFARADDNTVVLRSEVHGWSVVLLSELGVLGRKALLERGDELRADILVCGVPESGEGLDLHLLETVAPRLVVIGQIDAPYKRAKPRDLLKCARQTGAFVVKTSNESAVTLKLTQRECRVETQDGWFALPR
jgi:competence protein ComEC